MYVYIYMCIYVYIYIFVCICVYMEICIHFRHTSSRCWYNQQRIEHGRDENPSTKQWVPENPGSKSKPDLSLKFPLDTAD